MRFEPDQAEPAKKKHLFSMFFPAPTLATDGPTLASSTALAHQA
jgi:hypothetical protein